MVEGSATPKLRKNMRANSKAPSTRVDAGESSRLLWIVLFNSSLVHLHLWCIVIERIVPFAMYCIPIILFLIAVDDSWSPVLRKHATIRLWSMITWNYNDIYGHMRKIVKLGGHMLLDHHQKAILAQLCSRFSAPLYQLHHRAALQWSLWSRWYGTQPSSSFRNKLFLYKWSIMPLISFVHSSSTKKTNILVK